MENLRFTLGDTGEEISFTPRKLFCLSYAGRTKEAREAHAQDVSQNGLCLEDPSLEFSPVSAILVTQNNEIQVMGESTAGEVEFVILSAVVKYMLLSGQTMQTGG